MSIKEDDITFYFSPGNGSFEKYQTLFKSNTKSFKWHLYKKASFGKSIFLVSAVKNSSTNVYIIHKDSVRRKISLSVERHYDKGPGGHVSL